MPAGNSILSTIFVQDLDGGASVKVNYHDSGPGDGTQPGERVELEGHPLIDAGTPRSDRRIISRLANKPKAEVVVTGGSVTLGIHIAVVADFPQELALTDGQTAELEADKGSPLMVYDEADNKWFALRGNDGVAQVEVVPSEDTDALDVVTMVSFTNPAVNTEFSYSLPSGTKEIYVKSPTPNAQLTISWTANGTLGSNNRKLYHGTEYSKTNLNPGTPRTFYWNSNTPNTKVEIETWASSPGAALSPDNLSSIYLHTEVSPTAGVEYSRALPAGTQEFYIQTSTPNAHIKLAWAANGTNTTNHRTLYSGTEYARINLDPTVSWTVYWQSNKDNTKIEIETWG
jgi:hypothetical protein